MTVLHMYPAAQLIHLYQYGPADLQVYIAHKCRGQLGRQDVD